jgi:AAA domain
MTKTHDYSEFFEGIMDISEPYTAPEHKWHVDGLLRVGTLNMLAADPKAGKSYLTRQLAAATVNGGKFLGRETRKGRVLMFALEETMAEIREHFAQLGVLNNVFILPIGYAMPDDATKRLGHLLEAHTDIKLVILDPIFKFVHIQDVNKYSPVNKALSPIASLAARTNVTMLATHHANKSYYSSGGSSILGSAAVRANTSANFILQLKEATRERCLCGEGRGETVNFPDTELIDGSDGFTILGEPLTIARTRKRGERKTAKRNSRTEKILSTVLDNPGITTMELVTAVGISKAVLLRTLESLAKDKHIVKTGTGSKTSPYCYSPKGIEIEVAA